MKWLDSLLHRRAVKGCVKRLHYEVAQYREGFTGPYPSRRFRSERIICGRCHEVIIDWRELTWVPVGVDKGG